MGEYAENTKNILDIAKNFNLPMDHFAVWCGMDAFLAASRLTDFRGCKVDGGSYQKIHAKKNISVKNIHRVLWCVLRLNRGSVTTAMTRSNKEDN